MSIEEKVKEAAEYIENGCPWKDVMDDSEVGEAIIMLAEILEEGRRAVARLTQVEMKDG